MPTNDPERPVENAGTQVSNPAASNGVLWNRDFLVFLVGRFVAVLGQQMLSVAVDWELYERTHSALALGLVGLSQMVPMVVCTLPAGHVADNYSRKRVMLITTLLLAVASFGLMLISALNAPVVWIYLCLVVFGVGRTFLWPASSAFLPHLVPRSQFTRAVTLNSGTFQFSSVAGPAVCGVLIALIGKHHSHPAALIYAINGAASLSCFVLFSLIHREHIVAARQRLSIANLSEGFRFVFENKIILGTITLDMFAVLLGGATSLLPIYAKEILGTGAEGLGLLRAAMPIGAVFCALILTCRPPLQKAGRSMLWSVAVFGLATIVFGLTRWFWLSFLMLFICGAVDNVSVVVRHSLVQLLTPDEKRGRVSAVNSLFIGTSNELGGFESGFVAQLFGPALGNTVATGAVLSVVTGGIGTVVVVVAVALIWPQIRRYGRLDEDSGAV
jgi:MFS family permease